MANLNFKLQSYPVKLSIRFNFTYHFLLGAASMTKLAKEIDNKGLQASEGEKNQHIGFVCGAIMQSVAALESEIWTIYNHGVGHHLGSNGLDIVASQNLKIVADDIDKISILAKYSLALKLARQKQLNLGSQPMQDVSLLISLRNEITHYKSLFTDEIEKKRLFNRLKELDSVPPSFYIGKGGNFYPLQCLSFRRAKWALNTTVLFIEHFYSELKVNSPLLGYDLTAFDV